MGSLNELDFNAIKLSAFVMIDINILFYKYGKKRSSQKAEISITIKKTHMG